MLRSLKFFYSLSELLAALTGQMAVHALFAADLASTVPVSLTWA